MNNIIRKYHPLFAIALTAIILVSAYLFIEEVRQGLIIDTDLRALLPESESDKLSKTTSQQFYSQLGNKLVIATASHDLSQATNAAKMLASDIAKQSQGLLTIQSPVNEEVASLATMLKPYRFHLLTPRQKELITENQQQLVEEAWQALFSFGSMTNSSATKDDPLNLFNNYLKSRNPAEQQLSISPPFLVFNSQDEINLVMLIVVVKENALDMTVQEKVTTLLLQTENKFKTSYPDVTLLKSGVLFHAAEAAANAKKEITLISVVSILGIILLYRFAFYSFAPLVLSLLSVSLGWLVAFALCHFLFSGLHIITLVFGATLIGVSIDYSLHYFTKMHKKTDIDGKFYPLATIFSAITLGLVTSILGYSSLMLTSLPGLNQVAVFSAAGLICSWLFVVAIYPMCAFKKIKAPTPGLITASLLARKFWHHPNSNTPLIVLATLLGSATVTCYLSTTFSDDPRLLHKPSTQLLDDEKTLQHALKQYAANQYFVISGQSPEEVLQKEEAFIKNLDPLINNGSLGAYRAITQFVPSLQTQVQNYELLKKHLYHPDSALTNYLTELGFEPRNIEAHLQDFTNHRQNLLTPENWPGKEINEFSLLWIGKVDNDYVSAIMLRETRNTAELAELADHAEGVFFISKIDELRHVLSEQQSQAIKLLFIAYAVVMIILAARYRDIRGAGLALIPITSTLITLTMLGLMQIPISLFHVFALFLVLGLGLDYTIFLYESKEHDSSSDLAIMLSALTSCLSFGLLSFSHTPMVEYFGTTILIGSLFNLLLAPIVCAFRPPWMIKSSEHAIVKLNNAP